MITASGETVLVLSHLRSFRAMEYESFEDCMVAVRFLYLYHSLAATAPNADAAAADAKYKADWPLMWALCDRCLRDTEDKPERTQAVSMCMDILTK